MACFDPFGATSTMRLSSQTTVTISGQVIDQNENPLQRVVVVCGANNLMYPIAIVFSSKTSGNFSVPVPGTVNTEFAVIVQGESGENCTVHSHITAG